MEHLWIVEIRLCPFIEVGDLIFHYFKPFSKWSFLEVFRPFFLGPFFPEPLFSESPFSGPFFPEPFFPGPFFPWFNFSADCRFWVQLGAIHQTSWTMNNMFKLYCLTSATEKNKLPNNWRLSRHWRATFSILMLEQELWPDLHTQDWKAWKMTTDHTSW